jgi:hypothetical protein
LKKPRSVSESEGCLAAAKAAPILPVQKQDSLPSMSNLSRSSFESRCTSSSDESQKKCVSFNNQVIRTTFKTGSTVAGMRKPGHSSKKKNKQRKRTVSDPSHDSGADALSLKETMANKSNGGAGGANAFRARSVSESSDDNRSMSDHACSNESVNEESGKEQTQPPEKYQQQNGGAIESNSSKKKKKKNKNNKSSSSQSSNSNTSKVEKKEENPFTVETMLEWKNQGRLGTDSKANGHVTKCNFKNKIIDQLD